MIVYIKNIINKNKEPIVLISFIASAIIIIKSLFFLPILISIIITYFLHNIKKIFIKFNFSNHASFIITYSLFLTTFLVMLMIFLPLIFNQFTNFFNNVPFILQKVKILTYDYFPILFSTEQTNIIFSAISNHTQTIGRTLINTSIMSITIVAKCVLYIFITPVLIFFLLKDYIKIFKWFNKIMPEKMKFWTTIWIAINKQIENYIRGKLIEVMIIALINYILFKIYNMPYADLLAAFVGLSVIIPYLGAIIISIPVILISTVQFGLSNDFFNIILFYTIIQLLDGNILVPLLFSEAVDLHPMSIIAAIIIFGATFGIYGVFFAIPFAIVIKAVINIYLTDQTN